MRRAVDSSATFYRRMRCPRTLTSAIGLLDLALSVTGPSAEAADQPPPAPDESIETVVVKSGKLTLETLIDRKVYTVTPDAQSTFGIF